MNRLEDLEEKIRILEASLLQRTEELEKVKKDLLQETSLRKTVEKEFQANYLQLVEAMDLARIVYWEVDPEKDFFLFSNNFYELYGTSAEREGGYLMTRETYGKKFVHPDDLPLFSRSKMDAETASATEYVSNLEHRIVCANGEVRHLMVRTRVLKDAEGHIIRIHGMNQDITDRKKAQEDLLHSLSLLNAALESTADGILVVDSSGKIINFNKKFTEMWRIPEEVMGAKNAESVLAFVLDQLNNPDEFIARVKELSDLPQIESFDVLDFKDGRIFERYSRPQYLGDQVVGRVWSFRDVTEHKKSEAALKETVHFLQLLMDAIPNPIFYKDNRGIYQGCNKAFEAYVGLSKKEIVGKSVYDIAPPHLADRYHEMDNDLFRRGGVQVYETSVRYADGSLHDVILNKATFANTGGAMSGLVGVILDISERKAAEMALKKSYALLKGVLESPGKIVIFALDREYRYIAFNRNHHQTMNRIWGVDIALGNNMLDYIHTPEDRLKAKNNFDRALSGESFILVEEYGDTAFDRRYYENIYNFIRNESGEVIGLTLFLTDITERKQAEEQMRLSEAYFRTLIENTSDIISILNPDGTVRYESPSVERVLGFTPSEMIGKNPFEFLHPDDTPALIASFKNDVETPGAVSSHEVRRRHKNGTWRLLEVLRQNLLDNEAVNGILINARDITVRKQMEEALHTLNDELERKVEERTRQLIKAQEELVRKEKLAILGQLAGTVGHEIRNPLGVISNAVYYLKTILSGADDTTKEYLDIIKQEIDNSLQIITDLLDFSRTTHPRVSSVSVSMLASRTLDRCSVPDRVSVTVNIPDTLPLLNIDLFQMIQVLQNLITNAVQAMPEGGVLTVSAHSTHSSPFTDKNAGSDAEGVEITVADTGSGISPENMKKLFQPLFTTKPRGVGLGLVVCKNLVEANGGEIAVESTVGEGTVFRVRLPGKQGKG